MKKLILIFIIFIAIVQFSSAADLTVNILEKNQLKIVGFEENPAFKIEIKNNEEIGDNFEIYSLVGVEITPKDLFFIGSGQTKILEVIASPQKETQQRFKGFYVFDYEIKGQKTGYFRDRLTIKIIELKNTIDVMVDSINPGDAEARITIKNLEDFTFDNLEVKSKS